MKPRSRAVLVVGMHRSGTSAVARGLQALNVYLGDNFLDAQPENPTGYWEDKSIVELNDRVLTTLGLRWDSVAPITRNDFGRFRIWRLRAKAARYVKRTFGSQPLWGFKDPRTIRLLPFWRRLLRDNHVDDTYVVVIRNPLSVAASLFRRQAMDVATAQRLWLVHMVPYMRDLRDTPMIVVDYDLLMREPRSQLERIARTLSVPSRDETNLSEIDRFTADFLDEKLRRTVFSPSDFEATTSESRLTKDAFLLLYDLATDRLEPNDSAFWSAWEKIEREFMNTSSSS
jgi:hypothetical protein